MLDTATLFRHLESTGNWHRYPPASHEDVYELQTDTSRYLGQHDPLPIDYIQFLEWSNGGEGKFGRDYVRIWSAKEILDKNRAYQVDKWLPKGLGIGNDAGDEGYFFDFRTSQQEREPPPIYRIELGSLVLGFEEGEKLAASFSDWLKLLFADLTT